MVIPRSARGPRTSPYAPGQEEGELRRQEDPDRDRDIVSLEMISGLTIKQGNVFFSIEVDPRRGPDLEPMRQAAAQAVEAIPGVLSVTAVLTAHREAQAQPQRQQAAPQRPAAPGQKTVVPGVEAIIAVEAFDGARYLFTPLEDLR